MTTSKHVGSGPVDCPVSGMHRLCECRHCKEFRKLKVDLADARKAIIDLSECPADLTYADDATLEQITLARPKETPHGR